MTGHTLIKAGAGTQSRDAPGLRGSQDGLSITIVFLASVYLLLIGLSVALSFAHLADYTTSLSDWSFSAYRRVDLLDIEAIMVSLAIACVLAMLCVGTALSVVCLMYWWRRPGLLTGLLLPGFLCCPALRSIALPTLSGQFIGTVNSSTASTISIALAILCYGATAFPLCLAICLLGASGRMARYLEIYRNLGGSIYGALRSVAVPVLRPSAVASFLVATPIIAFDPYSLRVAGGQVLPSSGALLIDLRSASDWPLIAVICLLSLLLLLPFYLLLLPATTRSP